MASLNPPAQPQEPTTDHLTIELNNTKFIIAKHLTPKGSVLDTVESDLDLTFVLPIYLGPLCQELFSIYLVWLHTRDETALTKDQNPAIRITKATMLLQIGTAVEDEVFCGVVTEHLKGLYGVYDGQFGPTPRLCHER